MATWRVESSGESFSLERVISRTVEAIAANPLLIFGTTFVLTGLPNLVLVRATAQVWSGDWGPFGRGPGLALYLVVLLVIYGLSALTQGAVIRAVFAWGDGRQPELAECLEAGFMAALPLMALTILSALGIAIAAIALLIPALILATSWVVGAPALVAEKLGPTDALARSQDLTRGARWKIFALVAALWLGAWILAAVSRAATAVWLSPAGAAPGVLGYTLDALRTTIVSSVSTVIHAVLYLALREWKEGPAVGRLGEIFA